MLSVGRAQPEALRKEIVYQLHNPMCSPRMTTYCLIAFHPCFQFTSNVSHVASYLLRFHWLPGYDWVGIPSISCDGDNHIWNTYFRGSPLRNAHIFLFVSNSCAKKGHFRLSPLLNDGKPRPSFNNLNNVELSDIGNPYSRDFFHPRKPFIWELPAD